MRVGTGRGHPLRLDSEVVEPEAICLACGHTASVCRCFRQPDLQPSLMATANSILKRVYLPAIREQLNKSMILMEHLDEKGMDPAIPGMDMPSIVGDAAIDEFRRRRSRSRNHVPRTWIDDDDDY